MNITKAIEIAIMFARMDAVPVSKEDSDYISHPFFRRTILSDSNGTFNVFEEPTRYNSLVQELIENLKLSHTVDYILSLMENSFKAGYLSLLRKNGGITFKECCEISARYWDEVYPTQDAVAKTQILSWIKRADRMLYMTQEDFITLSSFPDTITIYRGTSRGIRGLNGISWTTNKSIAQNYAEQGKNGILFAAEVDVDNIIGYTNKHRHNEVLVDYRDLKNIRHL